MQELDFEGFKKTWNEMIGEDHDGFQIVFNALDSNGDGTVSMQELMDWFAYDFVMNSDERLWDFLEIIDKEKTGENTQEQYEEVLRERAQQVNWEEYFADIEAHDYKEFALLFRLDTAPEIFTELVSECSMWSTFTTVLGEAGPSTYAKESSSSQEK